jgi:hypothetical protein
MVGCCARSLASDFSSDFISPYHFRISYIEGWVCSILRVTQRQTKRKLFSVIYTSHSLLLCTCLHILVLDSSDLAMKIILTGATGYIGTEVLKQAIADPAISSIYTLTRKPLSAPYAAHEKAKGIIHKDFASYDEETLRELKGAEACIWYVIEITHAPFPLEDYDRPYSQVPVAATSVSRGAILG